MMTTFEYVSKLYTSNCFIEAVKAKVIGGTSVKLYFCLPRIHKGKFQMCHFLWSDGEYDYDFSDNEVDELPWYRCLLFKGQIRRFPKGFASRYSKYRNTGKMQF